MRDVFQIIPENTVKLLEVELANLFTHQEELDRVTDKLQLEPTNEDFLIQIFISLPCY